MDNQDKLNESVKKIRKMVTSIVIIFTAISLILICILIDPTFSNFTSNTPIEDYVIVTEINEEDYDKIENGVHVRTGFVDADGLMLVVNNCTNCHSAKLVTQNRMSKERWVATIRWMQETQNLWNLGDNEEVIVNYLATNYAPTKKGRRQNLTDIDWYELESK